MGNTVRETEAVSANKRIQAMPTASDKGREMLSLDSMGLVGRRWTEG